MAKPDQKPNKTVLVGNRQKIQSVDVRLLRRIVRTLLLDFLRIKSFELSILVLDASEMAELNERFLRHRGSTDVLTFDYAEPKQTERLYGEIMVCVDEAQIQANRFRTSWQKELVRYVVHGTLHLCGYDDHRKASRRLMKQEEDRLLEELAARFQFSNLGRTVGKVPERRRFAGLNTRKLK